MPRMNILNTVEREAFESPPVFNSVQRKQYFDFPTELRRLAGELLAPTHQLGFLLSASYFKAAKSFFPASAFHRRDLEYVIGIGCMIGLCKMMRISHPINEAELEHTVNWHFSVDGRQAASDLQTAERQNSTTLAVRK